MEMVSELLGHSTMLITRKATGSGAGKVSEEMKN
jgi:hypothetical protein